MNGLATFSLKLTLGPRGSGEHYPFKFIQIHGFSRVTATYFKTKISSTKINSVPLPNKIPLTNLNWT